MSESVRPAWTLGGLGLPKGLSAGRAWRWCVLRTVRDGRLARRLGRPAGRHQLGRLFARRWDAMSQAFDEMDVKWFFSRLERGRDFIGKGKR